jgi:hypothetical protein
MWDMDNFFSSPILFEPLLCTYKENNCCGTVRNRKGTPKSFGQTMKMKWSDMKTRVRHKKYWPVEGKLLWYHVCSAKAKRHKRNLDVQNAMY